MIPFSHRFHGHNSLRFVYKNGNVVRSRYMTLKSIDNPHRKLSRIAVIISKKVMKSAVRRNRIRRRIYEQVRIRMEQMDKNYDIAIIVSSGELLGMSASDISEQIESLFSQAALYKTTDN